MAVRIPTHQVHEKMNVVNRAEAQRADFARFVQVAQIGAAKGAAGVTGAVFLHGPRIFGESRIAQIDAPVRASAARRCGRCGSAARSRTYRCRGRRLRRCPPAHPRPSDSAAYRQAAPDTLRPVSRTSAPWFRRRPARRWHSRGSPARPENRRSARRRSGKMPPWTMPKRAWSVRVWAALAAFGPAMCPVQCLARCSHRSSGSGHSSSTIAMSAPSACSISMTASGRESVEAAVDMAAKGNAVVVQTALDAPD